MTAAFNRAELEALGYEERAPGHWAKVRDSSTTGHPAPDGERNDGAKEASNTRRRHPSSAATAYRSKWEAERATYHEMRKRGGLIRDWRYEPVRLKLADGAWYKIDFMIVHNDGSVELEEVKGYWRAAARVRFKVAVSQYPMFAFTVVTKQKGQWHILEERCGGWFDIVAPTEAA